MEVVGLVKGRASDWSRATLWPWGSSAVLTDTGSLKIVGCFGYPLLFSRVVHCGNSGAPLGRGGHGGLSGDCVVPRAWVGLDKLSVVGGGGGAGFGGSHALAISRVGGAPLGRRNAIGCMAFGADCEYQSVRNE